MAKSTAKGGWRIFVLALALVLAQGIGLIHGIAHASLLTNAYAEQADDAPDSFLERLFGDHHDQNSNAKCHLFVQSNHLDGISQFHSVALPTYSAIVITVASSGLFTARWLAAFNARGPPSFR